MNSVNYNKMKKSEVVARCKKLEELLMIKNINISKELLEEIPKKKEYDTITNYGIDAYFNKENEEEVCINVKF
jgi:hypothetical protein